MGEVSRIFKTMLGYLSRPSLYPELIRKTYKNVLNRGNATKGKDEAIKWAKNSAISTQEFFTKNFPEVEIIPFEKLFPEDFSFAEDQQRRAPVKMGGAGNLDLIYYICEISEAKNVIETGVAYGWSSLAALESLKHREGILYSSDMPYLAQNADAFVGCVVPEYLRKNWKLFRQADREALPKIKSMEKSFEVIHYDSDKSYNGMAWAYNYLFPLLNKGGFFISDDIGDNAAFMDFCKENNLTPSILNYQDKYIGILQK